VIVVSSVVTLAGLRRQYVISLAAIRGSRAVARRQSRSRKVSLVVVVVDRGGSRARALCLRFGCDVGVCVVYEPYAGSALT
jgi:hypothetical protein